MALLSTNMTDTCTEAEEQEADTWINDFGTRLTGLSHLSVENLYTLHLQILEPLQSTHFLNGTLSLIPGQAPVGQAMGFPPVFLRRRFVPNTFHEMAIGPRFLWTASMMSAMEGEKQMP